MHTCLTLDSCTGVFSAEMLTLHEFDLKLPCSPGFTRHCSSALKMVLCRPSALLWRAGILFSSIAGMLLLLTCYTSGFRDQLQAVCL